MSDEHTPDTPEAEPSDADTGPDPVETEAPTRDWIVPVVGLGALVLSVLIFFGGFAVGRATGDDTSSNWEARAEIRMEHQQMMPRGLDDFLQDFGRRGPQGRYDAPDLRRFGNLEAIPEAMLERACELFDEGVVPEGLPFADRLAELCDAEGA